MPKTLSPAQIEAFIRDGFLFGFDAISPEAARGLRTRLEDYERARGAAANTPLRVQAHPGFPGMAERRRPR